MGSAIGIVFVILGLLVAVVVGAMLVVYLVIPLFRVIGWTLARIGRFFGGELADVFRFFGAIITTLVFVPMILGTVVIGRWSAASHYGRALQREFSTMGGCLYRVFLGHPARLLGLTSLTEGLENRVPEVVRATPGADRPASRAGQFEGYTIIGSLMGGGSGGKLYIAEPDAIKRAALERQGFKDISRVVIKTFSLRDGSTLPQIVRESRALDAARRLGLVLDHDLTPERFFYITRYVPGEPLGVVTQHLHAQGGSGLHGRELARAMKYVADLLGTLDAYHRGGLWHKDVKPDNIIVHDDTAHLVDLGLVTPLRSAMTLTTHGTEYFRDPEMVRMALKGVKVHQVDGAKFDVYAVGAVLYSLVENSFPAHGGLSQITRRCPEAVRWIVRRAMADYDKRYQSAGAMLADLEAVRAAADPFAVRPADLPSVRAGDAPYIPPAPEPEPFAHPAAAASPFAAGVGSPPPPPHASPEAQPADVRTRRRPRIVVTDWLRGSYRVQGHDDVPVNPAKTSRAVAAAAMANAAAAMNRAAEQWGRPGSPAASPAEAAPGPAARHAPRVRAIPDPGRRPASEQLRAARERAAAARARAHARMSRRTGPTRYGRERGVNAGVGAAVFGFIGLSVLVSGGLVVATLARSSRDDAPTSQVVTFDDPALPGLPGLPALPSAGAAQTPTAEEIFHSRVSSTLQDASARLIEFQEVVREASGLAAVAAQSPGGTVIVVTDVLPPMTKGARSSIESAVARLTAFGFRLVGSVPGVDVDEAEIDRQIELIAQVRAARGQRPLHSADTHALLQKYLASNRDAGDAIIWIAPGDDRDEPTFHLVVRPEPEGETIRGQRLRKALQTALDPAAAAVPSP